MLAIVLISLLIIGALFFAGVLLFERFIEFKKDFQQIKFEKKFKKNLKKDV